MAVVDTLLALLALGLLVPCAIFLFECIAALAPRQPPRAMPAPAPGWRVAVLVPAHDEEGGIGATVKALLAELPAGGSLVVVADNCTDGTAAAARAAGATVIERNNPDQRGKGFAIVFGLDYLAAAAPDIVVLVDADCRVTRGGIDRIARLAQQTGRPVQAQYLFAAPERSSPLAAVSALALLVKNRVRPLGLYRLGLPCQLTGSGMAFPWTVIRNAPSAGSNLVEDLVTGLELALAGHPPLLCPEVTITSELPDKNQAALRQRRRWEHGQMSTLLQYGPRLLGRGLVAGRAGLVALGLDLVVPPLALLVMLLTGGLLVTGGAAYLGASAVPAALVASGLAALVFGVLGAWLKFGRATVSFGSLLVIPFYVLWKIPLYVTFVIRGKHKSWERTTRAGEAKR